MYSTGKPHNGTRRAAVVRTGPSVSAVSFGIASIPALVHAAAAGPADADSSRGGPGTGGESVHGSASPRWRSCRVRPRSRLHCDSAAASGDEVEAKGPTGEGLPGAAVRISGGVVSQGGQLQRLIHRS